MPPILVLLPGLDGTGEQFALLKAVVTGDFEVKIIAYPNQALSYTEHTQFVLESLPKQERYIIVAESYSGPIAVNVAAKQPPGLAGIILSATFLKCPRPLLSKFGFLLKIFPPWQLPRNILLKLIFGSFLAEELLPSFNRAVENVSPAVLNDRLYNVTQVDVTAVANKLSLPALYLRASSDNLIPRSAGEYLAAQISGLKIRELEGPHCLLQACAKESSDVIREFIRINCSV